MFFFFLPKTSRSALLLGSSTRQERPAASSFPHTHIEPSFGRFFLLLLLLWLVRKIQFFFSVRFLSLSLSLLLSSEFSSLRLLCSRGRLMRMLYTLSLFLFILLLLFSLFSSGPVERVRPPSETRNTCTARRPLYTHTHNGKRRKKKFFIFCYFGRVGHWWQRESKWNRVKRDRYICVCVRVGWWIVNPSRHSGKSVGSDFLPKRNKTSFCLSCVPFWCFGHFRSVVFWIAKTAENGICIGEALKVPKGPAIGHP